MTEAQEQKAERVAIAIAAAAAALLGHAIITGQPINDPCGELHGQSRIACAKEAGIRANEGYRAMQADDKLTVGELRRWLEDFDDDDEIVTHDLNDGYGADWGHIEKYDMTEDCPDDDEDEYRK